MAARPGQRLVRVAGVPRRAVPGACGAGNGRARVSHGRTGEAGMEAPPRAARNRFATRASWQVLCEQGGGGESGRMG
jgi:hypothetical protein